jgi:hypothetical protein
LRGRRTCDDRQCDAVEEISAGDPGHGANLTAAGGATDARPVYQSRAACGLPTARVFCPREKTGWPRSSPVLL